MDSEDSNEASIISDSTTNSIPASTDESKANAKRRKNFFFPTKILSSEKASFHCEWNLCNDVFTKMEKFLFHVAEHVALYQEPLTAEGYLCSWRECAYTSHSKTELDRHIYFHAYHTKIKAVGELFMEQYSFQCKLDNQNRNVLPEIPDNFHCFYKDCHFPFLSAQDYYWHVQAHAKGSEENEKTKMHICEWEDCMKSFSSRSRLEEHLKSHSQEKVIGCPQCGSIFGAINRFYDHCLRNLDVHLQKYKCSHCKASFASERLLREHVRRHINHYKCPFCEMTCPTKPALEIHVRYRHSEERPYCCSECNRSFKVQCDLLKHLSTHSKDCRYSCFFEGCGFSCRNYESYVNHIKTVHEGASKKRYMCHICDLTFSRGGVLSVHLRTRHNFGWPAGHSRFRYNKGEDGYYRIQTTRLESIELAQLMMSQAQQNEEPGPSREHRDLEANENNVNEGENHSSSVSDLEPNSSDCPMIGLKEDLNYAGDLDSHVQFSGCSSEGDCKQPCIVNSTNFPDGKVDKRKKTSILFPEMPSKIRKSEK